MGFLNAIEKGLKVISGVQAFQDRKKASTVKEEAEALIKYIEEENQRRKKDVNKVLSEFGKLRCQVLKETVGEFLRYLDIMEQKNKETEYQILRSVDISSENLGEMKSIDMNASQALKTAGMAGTAAAVALTGVPTLVTSTVSALATASTGTAIGSLSGAAATNATLAWLGGGSIAAGGGGMAAGATVLATATYATAGVFALASAGIVASAYYSKKYTEATKQKAEVEKWAAEIRIAWELMEAVKKRAIELQKLTLDLKERTIEQLIYLEPLVSDFENANTYYATTFQKSALLVKAISELAKVPLMDETGKVSQQSGLIAAKIDKILNTNL